MPSKNRANRRPPGRGALAPQCPGCNNRDTLISSNDKVAEIDCRSCGEYEIETQLAHYLQSLEPGHEDYRLKHFLGCYTRQQEREGRRAKIVESTWRQIARHLAETTFERRVELLEALYVEKAGSERKRFFCDPEVDCRLVNSPRGDEFELALQFLIKRRVIESMGRIDATIPEVFRLTADTRIAPDQNRPRESSRTSKGESSEDLERLLEGKEKVTHKTAADYLGVTERYIRKLHSSEKLQTVGHGQHKRITAESLREYKGTRQPKKPPEITNPESNGTKRN